MFVAGIPENVEENRKWRNLSRMWVTAVSIIIIYKYKYITTYIPENAYQTYARGTFLRMFIGAFQNYSEWFMNYSWTFLNHSGTNQEILNKHSQECTPQPGGREHFQECEPPYALTTHSWECSLECSRAIPNGSWIILGLSWTIPEPIRKHSTNILNNVPHNQVLVHIFKNVTHHLDLRDILKNVH